MAEKSGVIRWQENHSLGIAADDPCSGSNVHLKQISSDYAKWEVDKDAGIIRLNYASGQLYLGYAGAPSSGSALVLTVDNIATWDFSSKPGFIMLKGTKLAIDVQSRNPGGVVWLYTFNASPAQQWAFMSYANFTAEAAKEAATV